jgi:hypothetical protein
MLVFSWPQLSSRVFNNILLVLIPHPFPCCFLKNTCVMSESKPLHLFQASHMYTYVILPVFRRGRVPVAPCWFHQIHMYIRVRACLKEGEASHEASDLRNVPRGGSGLCAPHAELTRIICARFLALGIHIIHGYLLASLSEIVLACSIQTQVISRICRRESGS